MPQILVVDDDPDVGRTLRDLLAVDGQKVKIGRASCRARV